MKKFNGTKKIVIPGRDHYDFNDESRYIYFKYWEKSDKRRVYLNDYRRRTIGYIDCETKEFLLLDNQGLSKKDEIFVAVDNFLKEIEVSDK